MLALMLALGLSFDAAPWPVVYTPAILGVVVLIWARVDLGLLLVLAFIPASMQPKHLGPKQFPPSEIFLAVCVLVVILSLVIPTRRGHFGLDAVRNSPFLVPAGVFLLAAAASTVLAADRAEASRAFREDIFDPLVWFILMLLFQKDDRAWRRAFGVLIAAGGVAGAIAIGQFVTRYGLSTTLGSNLVRAPALYGSPDNLGLLLDRVLPMWFAVLLLARLRSQIRTAWLTVGAIMALGLLFTFSRGAWVAVALACAMLVVMRGRHHLLVHQIQWLKWTAIPAGLIAIGLALYGGPRAVNALRSGHANTGQRRVYVWRSSLRMIADHPLVGVGPDNFVHYYAPRTGKYLPCSFGKGYVDSQALQEPCLSHPHNEVLDLWLSTGIVGLAAFIWLQFVFWSRSLSAYVARSDVHAILVPGAMAAMLAALIHGLVDNSYFLIDLSTIFWMLCAYVSYVDALSLTQGEQA